MQAGGHGDTATAGEMASIDESIALVEQLDAGVDSSRELQRLAGQAYGITVGLGNDVQALVEAADALRAHQQISADTVRDMTEPVKSAVSAFRGDPRRPEDIVAALIEHQMQMRANCWREDVEVKQARELVDSEKGALSEATSYENDLPGQLDDEIRSAQDEAHSLRMTDPADAALEREAQEAKDEVPRASSRLNAAEGEEAQKRQSEERARSALREAEAVFGQARRENEAATAARVQAAQAKVDEARRDENGAQSALRDAEWQLEQARRESDGAESNRVSAVGQQVAQARWQAEQALDALRAAEQAVVRARGEGDKDGRLSAAKREFDDRQRQFERAEGEHRDAERQLHDARSALNAAQKAEVDTRREADMARQRNQQRLDSEATRLEQQAAGLISSRQGKLDQARDGRLAAEERLRQALARRDSAVDAACWARRDASRTAERMSDLDKIDSGVAACVQTREAFVAWAADSVPRCEGLKSSASQSASLLEDDIAQTEGERDTEASAVSDAEGRVASAENQVENAESQIEGTLRLRRRRYRQIWFICLPLTLLVASPVLAALRDTPIEIFSVAAWCVTLALHIVNWRRSRNRLTVLDSELERSNTLVANRRAELDAARARAQDAEGSLNRLKAAVSCCERFGAQAEPVERLCREVTEPSEGRPGESRVFDADAVTARLQRLRSLEA